MTEFLVTFEQLAGVSCVQLRGELDGWTVPKFRDDLQSIPGPVVIDCQQLNFIDSSGIYALEELALRIGSVTLRAASPMLRRLLDICNITSVIACEDLDRALISN
jgi:anti-anti-sigma factor